MIGKMRMAQVRKIRPSENLTVVVLSTLSPSDELKPRRDPRRISLNQMSSIRKDKITANDHPEREDNKQGPRQLRLDDLRENEMSYGAAQK